MIDYIKVVIRDDKLVKQVWSHPRLELYSEREYKVKGKTKTFQLRTYLGLNFTLYHDRLEITGSLHKYFNNGIHNANDFTISNCIHSILELKKVFKLDLKRCSIVNLEFGLNLLPLVDVQIIVANLLLHGKNQFRALPDLEHAKQAGKFNSHGYLNEYKVIKAYAKGFEPFKGRYYCNRNTFRFEVKSKQSKYINRLGIYNLEDLVNTNVYFVLTEEIIKEWTEVLLIEKDLPGGDEEFATYKSFDFWHDVLDKTRNSFSRAKKNYFKLLSKYPDNSHRQIKILIENKLKEFISESENGANSTDLHFSGGANSTTSLQHDGANSTDCVSTCDANSTIVKLEFAPKRCCLVTELPIDMQDTKSKFLTPVGLKWYEKHQPLIYEKLKKQFLPRSGISGKHTLYERDEYGHLAKQIRNQHHNPKRNKTHVDKAQLTLLMF